MRAYFIITVYLVIITSFIIVAYFVVVTYFIGGTWWRGWLRYCARSWKVVGSIPDGVTGIFR
jgi:threonine/homoserine/homoserine lactone efflux protein